MLGCFCWTENDSQWWWNYWSSVRKSRKLSSFLWLLKFTEEISQQLGNKKKTRWLNKEQRKRTCLYSEQALFFFFFITFTLHFSLWKNFKSEIFTFPVVIPLRKTRSRHTFAPKISLLDYIISVSRLHTWFLWLMWLQDRSSDLARMQLGTRWSNNNLTLLLSSTPS